MQLGRMAEAHQYLEQYWHLSKDNKKLNYQVTERIGRVIDLSHYRLTQQGN